MPHWVAKVHVHSFNWRIGGHIQGEGLIYVNIFYLYFS